MVDDMSTNPTYGSSADFMSIYENFCMEFENFMLNHPVPSLLNRIKSLEAVFDQIVVQRKTLDGCFSNQLFSVGFDNLKFGEVITTKISLNQYRFYQFVNFSLSELVGEVTLILHYEEYL